MKRSYRSEGTRTDLCYPWMTAADRCLGYVGGMAGEDQPRSSVAATVTSSTGGLGSSSMTTCLVGKGPQAHDGQGGDT
jgi:hypothetical protein